MKIPAQGGILTSPQKKGIRFVCCKMMIGSSTGTSWGLQGQKRAPVAHIRGARDRVAHIHGAHDHMTHGAQIHGAPDDTPFPPSFF